MKDAKLDKTEVQDSHDSEVSTEKNKKPYISPICETHNPLKIMSAWNDQSSELVF